MLKTALWPTILWNIRTLVFACVLIVVAGTYGSDAFAAGQGCPNEGPDTRLLGKVGCKIQRIFSFHSTPPPKWLLAKHDAEGDMSEGIAFPPYIIIQSKDHFFRLGWRFDTNWHGYIFPTAALKRGHLPKGY